MDGKQFDNMARALRVNTPRRGALGWLAGGALGLAGLAGSEAKGGKGGKGGKGKGKDKDKEICKKAAAKCRGSKCGVGATCCKSSDCDCRQSLYCNFDGSKSKSGTCGCDGDDIMHNGRCGEMPVCISAGVKREFSDPMCCSGSAITDINNPNNGMCLPGNLLCLANSDCTGGQCRGFKCYAPELDCNVYL